MQCSTGNTRRWTDMPRASPLTTSGKRPTWTLPGALIPHFTLYSWVTNICRRLNTATLRAASTVLLARVSQVGSGLPAGEGSSSGGRKERFRTPVVQTFWCTALHLCFEQAQPKMYHSPKVDDRVGVFYLKFLENQFLDVFFWKNLKLTSHLNR